MSFYIIGTAGHIDHGKTELSKALTGINTDRLKEEQDRGISIKLGFAPFSLGKDIKLGLVDVPGHEKFINQMMSGASGMDIVILVISATEGIMPQTKEHLAIISILGIKNIIVALTKKSLVEEDIVKILKEDISACLSSFDYFDTPIIPLDSITGEGIEDLKSALREELQKLPEKIIGIYSRLPVDRVFSLTGHGTIITGTLWSGSIKKGDSVIIFPINKKVKIRNIQVHGQEFEKATAGQRVALNIPEVKPKEIPSGSFILKENIMEKTFKLLGKFKLLPEQDPLKNNSKIRAHLGTGESLGKLILLENEEIFSKNEELAGLYLKKPMGSIPSDILIIRSENNSHILGSFKVIDNLPEKFKRRDGAFIEAVYANLSGTGLKQIVNIIQKEPFIFKKELLLRLALSERTLEKLLSNAKEIILEIDGQYVLREHLKKLEKDIISYLKNKLETGFLIAGIAKEEIRSKFFKDLNQKTFNAFLKLLKDSIEVKENFLSPKEYRVEATAEDQTILNKILKIYQKDEYLTKSPKELSALLKIGEDKIIKYLSYLLSLGKLVKIHKNIYISHKNYSIALNKIINYCKREGSIDIGEAKKLLNTSRKYIIPLLEYLDYSKITKKTENKRVLLRR